MKKFLNVLFLFLIIGCSKDSTLKDGDIIFQESQSNQSTIIKELTNSRYTHCGVILIQHDQPYVFEAVEPVKVTPLSEWIERGVDHHYVVKRLNRELTGIELGKMLSEGRKFEGKPYDLQFMWSDSKLYCSELIWKIYKNSTGIELNTVQYMRDFDTDTPSIQKFINERWSGTLPDNEPVLTPLRLFEAPQLQIVTVVN